MTLQLALIAGKLAAVLGLILVDHWSSMKENSMKLAGDNMQFSEILFETKYTDRVL